MKYLFVGLDPLTLYYIFLLSEDSETILYSKGFDLPAIRSTGEFKVKLPMEEVVSNIDGVVTDIMDLVDEKFDATFFIGQPYEVLGYINEFLEANIETHLLLLGCDGLHIEEKIVKDVDKKINMARILTDTHVKFELEKSMIKIAREERIILGYTIKRNESDLLLRIRDNLHRKRVRVLYYEQLRDIIWKRAALISIVDGLSSVLQTKFKILQNSLEIRDLMESLTKEIEIVARKTGIDLSNLFRDITLYLSKNVEKVGIFYELAKHGKKTGVEFFNGALIDEASKLGLKLYYNKSLYVFIKALEESIKLSKM